MLDLSKLGSCLDVTDEHIAQALAAAKSLSDPSPREKSLALLARMVEIAAPNSGVPRMLVLFAQMARRDWIEGDLVVRLIGDAELTVVELLSDDGASRERIAGPLRIDVSLEEFRSAITEKSALLASLTAIENSPRRLVLKGTRDYRMHRRKPSISAFAFDLANVTGTGPGRKADPPPRAPEKAGRGPPPLPSQKKSEAPSKPPSRRKPG